MSQQRFQTISLSGSPAELGYQHGLQLKSRIEKTLDYYLSLFALKDSDLLAQAAIFKNIITEFNPAYSEEIEAIGEGAGIDSGYIYALNSRSEILNNLSIPECTAIYHRRSGLLAQNWDWSEVLEPLVVQVTIDKPGHRVTMLTEPGIIGKIGMNSAGMGVCLNILKVDQRLQGVPVHIILRAILDCQDIDQVKTLLAGVELGKASHILVASKEGDFLSREFAGKKNFSLDLDQDAVIHTNHYLMDENLNQQEAFPSTRERLQRAQVMYSQNSSPAGIKALLLDQSEAERSICRAYSPSATPGFGNVGTVFSIIMKLSTGEMLVRPGSSDGEQFYTIKL